MKPSTFASFVSSVLYEKRRACPRDSQPANACAACRQGTCPSTCGADSARTFCRFRFGPYYCEPVIAGLDADGKPYLTGMDLIGAMCVAQPLLLVNAPPAPVPPTALANELRTLRAGRRLRRTSWYRETTQSRCWASASPCGGLTWRASPLRILADLHRGRRRGDMRPRLPAPRRPCAPHQRCDPCLQEPEDLFETISQCLLAGVNRDCLSGWGGVVTVITKDKTFTRTLKGRMD